MLQNRWISVVWMVIGKGILILLFCRSDAPDYKLFSIFKPEISFKKWSWCRFTCSVLVYAVADGDGGVGHKFDSKNFENFSKIKVLISKRFLYQKLPTYRSLIICKASGYNANRKKLTDLNVFVSYGLMMQIFWK